jgi:hypothetical protein
MNLLGNVFLAITPRTQAANVKIEKWGHIKQKCLHCKGNNRTQRKSIEEIIYGIYLLRG